MTITADTTIEASFTRKTPQLSVDLGGGGAGSVTSSPTGIECGADCVEQYDYGTAVTLAGAPDAGSKAVVWSGCDNVNASNQCEVTMTGARDVIATFSPLGSNPLTVTRSGSGTGTVTSSPQGIDCGPQCAADFAEGTLVKLTGVPGPGSEAAVWDSCPGTVNAANQCEVTIDAAKQAQARFELDRAIS